MSQKEFNFLQMCIRVYEGTKTITEAAEYLSVSYRTMQGRLARFQSKGESGLLHKLRGSPANRCIARSHKSHILDIITNHYPNYSASYASE